jgi:hypothetical protein
MLKLFSSNVARTLALLLLAISMPPQDLIASPGSDAGHWWGLSSSMELYTLGGLPESLDANGCTVAIGSPRRNSDGDYLFCRLVLITTGGSLDSVDIPSESVSPTDCVQFSSEHEESLSSCPNAQDWKDVAYSCASDDAHLPDIMEHEDEH